jgi:Mrp family chromosome partitioning ATPase
MFETPGLTDVLSGACDAGRALQRVENTNLFVLAYGSRSITLASHLASPEGAARLTAVRDRFQFVFADVGALLRNPEGLLLASVSDGVVVALAQGKRRHEEVVEFRSELKRLNVPLCGAVLTTRSDKAASDKRDSSG